MSSNVFPERGQGHAALIKQLQAFKRNDVPWQEGRVFAYVYDPGPEASALVHEAFSLFLTENGLDPTAFPSTLALERAITAMAKDLVHGPDQAVGNFTSGGTESILLSVKTARDRARALQPEITRPEMVLPETAHAAFFKAAQYFDIKPVVTSVDPDTFRADPNQIEAAVTAQTILLVASAPSYAHGVVDPIEAIGRIAQAHDLLFHVDACMGGMYLPFAGPDVPIFDFRVAGVTQLSMDFHKWGYAAKGASCILYRSADIRRHQIFAWSGWTGYSVVNPTVLSTRGAGPMAACWAILHHLGRAGYERIVAQCQAATGRIIDAIDAMPGLYCLGRSDCNLMSFASDRVNVFTLAEDMRARGWYIQPQFGFGPSPANIHLSVGLHNLANIDAFLADLEAANRQAPAEGPAPGPEQLPPELGGFSPEDLFDHMGRLAGTDGSVLPDRMDGINSLLNGLPHATRDSLLTEFVNRLYRQAPSG
ncbi:MAG: aspartate aminotransferase family protein [Wenzhouxiangellaceae bacterium]|nr:MAG: aspartate aminotransferase family protein [Wenzhouxiangellaceae bacterium]